MLKIMRLISFLLLPTLFTNLHSGQFMKNCARYLRYAALSACVPRTTLLQQQKTDVQPLDRKTIRHRCAQPGACPEFDKFFEQYKLSGHMKQEVELCLQNPLCKEKFESAYKSSLEQSSRIFVKDSNITRIINAIRMKECIRRNNLYLLKVADKELGHTTKSWRVYAEKINYGPSQPISLELIKQLITLSCETGFRDFNYNNWHWDENGYFVCIDTEDRSFLIDPLSIKRKIDPAKYFGVPKHCKISCLTSLYNFNKLDEEALRYLNEKLDELKASPEGTEEIIPLPQNTEYDAKNLCIDFEKVKKEFFG